MLKKLLEIFAEKRSEVTEDWKEDFLGKQEQYGVKVSDVPDIFYELSENSKEDSFKAFIFGGANGAINIEFIYQDGQMCFDYCILAEGNIADEQKFVKFAESKGFPQTKMRNGGKYGFDYYRTTNGDIVHLCMLVMKELYNLKSDDVIETAD